jgi:glycolate dehydrogenase FAD-linked subunit
VKLSGSASLDSDLKRLLGSGAVLSRSSELYNHDSTELQALSGEPDAVVAPSDSAGLRRLIGWCESHQIPIVPRGGGTGMAGGAVPLDGGIVCSLERMDRVRAFDPEFWRIHVEAGVTTARLRDLARASGLYFPVDPGAAEQSQIGGNTATNAGGPHSFKYGVTRHWVTGLEAVVGGGTELRSGGPTRKDVAGYDLTGLLVGSEGTLGVISSVWLRLIPAPELEIAVIAGYGGIREGVQAILRVYAAGATPATLEFFDPGCIEATRAAFPGSMPHDVSFLVVANVDGTEVAARQAETEIQEVLAPDSVLLRSVADRGSRAQLERWRSGIGFAVAARRGGKVSEDIALPVDRLEEAILGTIRVGDELNLPACSWGHAGDGNVHATFEVDRTVTADLELADAGATRLFELALGLGGTVSGEHGLGWVKRDQFGIRFSKDAQRLQLQIKHAFDPSGVFNPGKKLGTYTSWSPRTPRNPE